MTTPDYDAKRYPVCAPWSGKRGISWTRVFKPQFEDGLRKHTDSFNSLHEFLVEETDYGGVNGPAHPAGAGLAALGFQSQAARRTRTEKCFGFILTHITNLDIIDAIHSHVAALPNPRPDNWVTLVWNWIDVTFGQPRQTGLLHANQTEIWTKTKLTDVGIHRETLRQYYSLLMRLNRERQNPYQPMDVWVKFLKEITFPPLLRDEAVKQLQNPTYVIAAGLPGAGGPDLAALVTAFEEMWHTKYDAGIEIKPQPAPRQVPSGSNRVDGLLSEIHLTEDELTTGYITQPSTPADGAFTDEERLCWKCRGWGHQREACPSPDKSRPIWACIQGLQKAQAAAAQRSRGRAGRPGMRIVRRPGAPPPAWRKPGMKQPAAHLAAPHQEEILYQYDDGSIYTEDGTMISEQAPDEEAATNDATQYDGATEGQTVGAQVCTTIDNACMQFSSPISFACTAGSNEEADEDHGSRPEDEAAAESESKTLPSNHSQAGYVRRAVAAGIGLGAALLAVAATPRARAVAIMMMTVGANCMQLKPRLSADPTLITTDYYKRNAFGAATTAAAASRYNSRGIIDSGTTENTSGRAKLFPRDRIEEWHPNVKVVVANGCALPVEWRGAMMIKVKGEGIRSAKKTTKLYLQHSLYVPLMPVTLISTKAIFKNEGIRTYLNDDLKLILPDGQWVKICETNTNYVIEIEYVGEEDDQVKIGALLTRPTLKDPLPLTWDLMHARLGHFSPERILASERYVIGVDFSNLRERGMRAPCDSCVKGGFKGHRKQARPPGKFVRFGQRIYSDSCAMPRSTPFGYTEMYIFYDACTRLIAIYFGKTTRTEEMIQVHKQFVADYKEWLPKGCVEEWYTDGGPEFSGKDMDKFCNEMSTRRRFIAPWNPWMNVSETGWRIILRPLRIILAAANVSKRLWPFAVAQIVRVHNALSSSSSTIAESLSEGAWVQAFLATLPTFIPPPSPWYSMTHKQADLSKIRVMFCEVEVLIRNKDDLRKRDKTDAKTMRGIHLGIDSRAIGYLVYLFDVHRFTTASFNDVYFRETVFPSLDFITGHLHMPDHEEVALPTEAQQQAVEDQDAVFPELGGGDRHDNVAPPGMHAVPADESQINHGPPSTRTRSRTAIRDSTHLVEAIDNDPWGAIAMAPVRSAVLVATVDEDLEVWYVCDSAEEVDIDCPSTTKEALSGPDASLWRAAYRKDLEAKLSNGTFTLVRRPIGKKVLPTKVAHALKRDPITNGVIERRARWVGKGFRQGPGDFKETYMATPTATTLRMFFAISMATDLHLAQGDVTKAFTLNPIDVELYCEQMPGMEAPGPDGSPPEETVCLLHKCLEGLKQAGNVWQTEHNKALKEFVFSGGGKFKQSEIDPCLFVMHASAGLIVIVVWVDDILVSYSSPPVYQEFKTMYESRFPSKHTNEVVKFAGISLDYKKGDRVTIHQRLHIEAAYAKYKHLYEGVRAGPIARAPTSDKASARHYQNIRLAGSDEERSYMKGKPYLSVLATLLYLSSFTLPHIAYHTSHLGQMMHDPSEMAYYAVLELLKYVYENRESYIIVYCVNASVPRAINEKLAKQIESTFGLHGYCDASWHLRSVAGYVILMFGGPLDWGARLIKVTCHSSSEAEVSSGCIAGRRIMFILHLIGEYGLKTNGPFPLFIDNTAAIELSKKLGVGSKTAHFQRWQHYLRWLVINKFVVLNFLSTKYQLGDAFTKILDTSTSAMHQKELYGIHQNTN